jgi:5-methylcytosine-specific restriction endonuclease McrA
MPDAPKVHTIAHIARASRRHVRVQDTKRGTSTKRGYGAKWQSFRDAFLIAHPMCEFCQGAGRLTPANVVDHDEPHRGDPEAFWATTFTALCKRCHDGTKQRLEAKHQGADLLAAIQRVKATGRG